MSTITEAARGELEHAIQAGDDEALAILLTVMWVGRDGVANDDGDEPGPRAHLRAFLDDARARSRGARQRDETIGYMLEKRPLALYLSDGLDALRNLRIHVDFLSEWDVA